MRYIGGSTAALLASYARDYVYLRQQRSTDQPSNWMRKITEDAVLANVMTPQAKELLEDEREMPALMRIYRANATALTKYRPKQKYHGRIDLYRTKDHAAKRHNQALEWDRATTGEVVVHAVGGTHMTIMRSPHVEQLARLIQVRLEEIEVTGSKEASV